MYDSSRLSAGGSVGSVFVREAERRDEVKGSISNRLWRELG